MRRKVILVFLKGFICLKAVATIFKPNFADDPQQTHVWRILLFVYCEVMTLTPFLSTKMKTFQEELSMVPLLC